MFAAVIDTHALIWNLYNDKRLSETASNFLDDVSSSENYVAISAITFVEVAYLMEKKRLEPHIYNDISSEVERLDSIFKVIDVSRTIADSLRSVPREEIPDMPDRIIAATAMSLGVPVITRDRLISAANLQTIW